MTGAVTTFSTLIFMVGSVSGVAALFGIPKHGTKGILIKALCGIVIPIGLAAIAPVDSACLHGETQLEGENHRPSARPGCQAADQGQPGR